MTEFGLYEEVVWANKMAEALLGFIFDHVTSVLAVDIKCSIKGFVKKHFLPASGLIGQSVQQTPWYSLSRCLWGRRCFVCFMFGFAWV